MYRLTILLLATVALIAAAVPALSGSHAEAGQSAIWLEREHDFGVIEESGGKVACTMQMVNIADTAISIIEVRSSCGCTAARYPKQPIAPGDTATITLVFNPNGRPGTFAKSVAVRLSSPPLRTSLTVRGTVRASESTLTRRYPTIAGPLRLSNHILPIGEVSAESSHNAILSAYNASSDTIRLEAPDAPKPLSVQFSKTLLPPGNECHITVTFDASKCPDCIGVTETPLCITATPTNPTDSSTMGMVKVTVVANVRNSVSSDFSAF